MKKYGIIEKSLGKTIRVYFVKDFYADHVKRYKKRPIYWMVSSLKKAFSALIYMHRYRPDIFARVQNSYLGDYITKLDAHKEQLKTILINADATNKEKKDAEKQIKFIEVKLKECIAFNRGNLTGFAQEPKEIDLDDGVKVNYCRFKEILQPISGLCK